MLNLKRLKPAISKTDQKAILIIFSQMRLYICYNHTHFYFIVLETSIKRTLSRILKLTSYISLYN